MRIRKILIGVVLAIVLLPVAVVLIAVGSISLMDRTNGTLVSSGETREYLLHVPAGYDGTSPVPLVIAMHAGATWPAQMRNLTRWNPLADEQGFLVVYPGGAGGVTRSLDVPRIWRVDRDAGRAKEVRFIAELIDTLSATHSIDPSRIYAAGMSNGGALAFVLSCTLGDRIAAVGVVAGAQSVPADRCPDPRPTPMIGFHGTADPLVPYGGGRLRGAFNPVRPLYPPVRDFTGSWAIRNGCSGLARETPAAPDVVRLEYADCPASAPVVLYTILDAGHTWPGGKRLPEWWVGRNSRGVDATREIWTFFSGHRVQAPPALP